MKKTTTQDIVSYFNLKIRMVLAFFVAHFVVVIPQEKSFLEIIKQGNYYIAMVFSFGVASLLLWMVQRITEYLDRHYSWEKALLKRLVYQLLLGVVAILLLELLLALFYFSFSVEGLLGSGFLNREFPIVFWMVVTLNLLLVCWYVAKRFLLINQYASQLQSYMGKRSYALQVGDICYIVREKNQGYAFLKNGKKYFIRYKMDELEEMLDSAMFVRINRSVIYALDAIEGYRSEKNAQCSLIIKSGYPVCNNLLVSRERTKKLKEKFIQSEKNINGGDGTKLAS